MRALISVQKSQKYHSDKLDEFPEATVLSMRLYVTPDNTGNHQLQSWLQRHEMKVRETRFWWDAEVLISKHLHMKLKIVDTHLHAVTIGNRKFFLCFIDANLEYITVRSSTFFPKL